MLLDGCPLIDLVKSIASIWLLWCMATVLICCGFSTHESVSFSLPLVWFGFHLLALVLNKFTARVEALVNTLNCWTMQQFSHSWPTIWPQQMHWLIYLSHHASFPHGSCPRRQREAKKSRNVRKTRQFAAAECDRGHMYVPPFQAAIPGLALVTCCNCYCCRHLQFADTTSPGPIHIGLHCHPKTGDRNEMKFCQAEPQQHIDVAFKSCAPEKLSISHVVH